MLLSKSEQFLKEYNDFKRRISEVADEKIKSELNLLLSQLVKAIQSIDTHHQELTYQQRLPDVINISRENVMNTRKKLIQLLDSWDRQVKSNA
jgi:hypothetical protein